MKLAWGGGGGQLVGEKVNRRNGMAGFCFFFSQKPRFHFFLHVSWYQQGVRQEVTWACVFVCVCLCVYLCVFLPSESKFLNKTKRKNNSF